MPQSRRQFLERLGLGAGAAMTYEAMAAMGMLAVPARPSAAFELRGMANGTEVVIMGGGLAGLATAYELMKVGYDVQVLEARLRPGGRCHTIRLGVASEEEGVEATVCQFDEGLYYNPGPMRIPHHHTATLGYCRELGVAIEVFVNDNDAAYLYQTKSSTLAGRRLRGREVRADLGGYTSELLAKALPDLELDAPLSEADREALLAHLRRQGALQEDGRYTGSARRGYLEPPGIGSGSPSSQLPLGDLLGSGTGAYVQTEYLQQAPMFQVVGGMDRLAAGFAAKLGHRIVYGAEICEIRQSPSGVSVTYMKDGHPATVNAPYGVCALPLNILCTLPVVDVDADLRSEFSKIAYSTTGKIGLQFKRRFWEEDDGIFGGISRTDQDIAQIVYPMYGYLGQKGVLIGYYQSGTRAAEMGPRSFAEREALALEQGAKIHPQYVDAFEHAFPVSWQNVRYNKGGWAQMSGTVRESVYPKLLEPDGRIYFAGDHCSYLTAWMAGALESGRYVAASLHTRAQQDAVVREVA